MQSIETILYVLPVLYVFFINITAFLLMCWDKRKSVKQDWRVSEVTLFILGFIGGSIGIIGGMYKFRHKTQKRSFQAIAILGFVISIMIYWLIGTMYI